MNKTIVPDAKNKAPESPQSNAQPSASAAPSAKRYDEAFKRQTVEHWIKTGKSGTQIAREIGVSYPSLKDWKRRFYGHAVPEREDLSAENRALKAELARVTEQRDILKKRSAFSPNLPPTLPTHPGNE